MIGKKEKITLAVTCWTCGNVVKNAKSYNCVNYFCGNTKEEVQQLTKTLEETYEFSKEDTSDNFTPGLLRWEGDMWIMNRDESLELEINEEVKNEIQKIINELE